MRIEEVTTGIVKYKESYSDKLGRYLVAAKKISPGEVILRDNPIVVGAASFNDNSLCFSCFRVIEPKPIGLKFPCPKCKVAIFCSKNCEVIYLLFIITVFH